MGTDKRERQKANRAAKLEAERAAEARQRRIRTIRNVVIAGVLLVLAMVVLSLAGCSSSSDGGSSEPTDKTEDAAGASDETCATVPGAELDYDEAPTASIDPDKQYTATFDTTEGTVVVALDTERTPGTVDNFIALAQDGYYDCTDLFRTEADSGIIQGGSPHTQSNTDPGPGYTIEDEGTPFSADDYGPGTIAMANTGQPNSSSAQFFFLANEGGRYLADPQLGPSAGSYIVFGTTTEGLDVLEKIAALDDGTRVPSKQVRINSVTIDEA